MTALLCLLLAAGPFEQATADVRDTAVVLVRFRDGTSKASAKRVVDQAGSAAPLTAAFFATSKGRFAALVRHGAVPVSGLSGLAQRVSLLPEVDEAWAYVFPRAPQSALPGEATFSFQGGQSGAAAPLVYRENHDWVQWNRRRLTDAQWHAKQAEGHPLADLAGRVGLPGRALLEDREGLYALAKAAPPDDVGEDLERYELWAPAGLVSELEQAAEAQKASSSKVVKLALEAAAKGKSWGQLPDAAERAPFDPGERGAEHAAARSVNLYLPRALLDEVDAAGQQASQNIAHLVHCAWRKAHPWKAPSAK